MLTKMEMSSWDQESQTQCIESLLENIMKLFFTKDYNKNYPVTVDLVLCGGDISISATTFEKM